MNVSQRLEQLNGNEYTDTITITDVPQGWFPAATENNLQAGSSTREVRVELMELPQSSGGTMSADPGLYVKSQDEAAVKVTVYKDGNELASNTTNYN